jgi:hypothetical protein
LLVWSKSEYSCAKFFKVSGVRGQGSGVRE